MGSQDSKSCSSMENKQERVLITRIYCTDVVYGLRRLPAGFYVAVEIKGKTTETSNSHVCVEKDMVEWNDEILLPAERSSTVSFKVYASFEHGPRLGNGELIGKLELTVGEVLGRNDQTQPIWFLSVEQKDVFPSCLSLRIVTERRISEVGESLIRLRSRFESDAMIQLARLTDAGHRSLSRYRQFGNARDLDEAIVCFERVRDTCPPDYPNRSAVQFNLATAKFILCQVNNVHFELDEPISLYRDVLQLRANNHPDHCATALDLSFALLARFQRRGDEADKTEAMVLLSRVAELSPMEGYTHRAAYFALQMAEIPIFTHASGVSRMDSTNSDDELIRSVRASILSLPDLDPRRPVLLSDLGTLLHRRFNDDGKLDNIHEAISVLQNTVQLTPDEHPDKPVLLNDFGGALVTRFERLGTLLDINLSISVLKEAEHLTSDGHPHRPLSLNNLGRSLLRRFEQLGSLPDLNKSISLLEEAVHLTPSGDPEKPVRLNNLGHSFSRRFERLGHLADINKSISLLVEALRLASSGHSEQPALLKNLGTSLLNRFVHLGNLEDINKSVLILEGAIHATSDGHPEKPAQLSNLGHALTRRFERLGDITDINKSISIFEGALHLTPDGHRNKPARLSNLGNVLMRRFEHLGDVEDINKSVSLQEEAVCLTPESHPDRPTWLCTLGDSLLFRFERFGDIADINRSIVMKEEAVQLTPDGHADKPILLNNLGSSLVARFERLCDFADLKKSISVKEEAVRLTPDGHPSKPARMNNLGNSLLKRFEHLGDLPDLNESISILEVAVHFTPDGHTERPGWLNNLGNSLRCRFECLGDLADLNGSISLKEEATLLTPDRHPDKPRWLNSLAGSVIHRFELLGDLNDLNKSISLFKQAVRLAPIDHNLNKPDWMYGLGGSLLYRFERLGDIEDMNESVSVLEEAVHLIPSGHPNKPDGLNNLGNALCTRFERLDDHVDIHRSVSTLEEAVHLTPDGHSKKPAWLNGLGKALLLRFVRLKDVVDINRSIQTLEEAIRLTPNEHNDKSIWLRNLGRAFLTHFELSREPSDLSSAAWHFSEAARSSTGPTFSRFRAARDWILSAHLEGNTRALLDAYTTAIGLLPQLAWIGLPLSERHRVLLDVADVARDGAAVALDAGLIETAIEWLEQGRSIVWSQFLQLRAPVDQLRIEHPALADRFRQISRELEHAGSRENATFRPFVDEAEAVSLEKEVRRHHHLALTRDKLLVEIRTMPGFDRFLLPRTIKQLATLAHSGPVVYLNASKQRCDALIVKANLGNVIPVPLPGITYSEVVQLKGLLYLLLKRGRLIISRDDISPLVPPDGNWAMIDTLQMLAGNDCSENRAAKVKPQRIEGYSPDDLFCSILECLWNKVVHPILEVLGLLTPQSDVDDMTHIFWCPTGPFSFLPLHAAGLYGTAEMGARLSDFAISSYIPTLGALGASAKKDRNAPSNVRLVCVPQPPTDGLKWLELVRKEMDHIKRLSASSPFVTLQESDGTVEDTTEKMKNSDWVHFACHGVQDPEDPLASGLCLADGCRLKLSDIVQLSRPDGDGGGLAFLSACQTAQGDEKLPEESVHLAAGMLLAGYGSVVATMWSIMDDDAPRVAGGVYEHLFRDGKVPDSKEAAGALHRAVQRLRNSGASFASWVPFIHVGG